MSQYISQKPMIALIPPISQKDRLDTFYYHYTFADLDNKLEVASNEMISAEDASLLITDGTHQTPAYTEKENGVLFLSSTNITKDGVDLTDCKYITIDLHQRLKKCQPKPGDVLIAKERLGQRVFSLMIFPHVRYMKVLLFLEQQMFGIPIM